MAGTRQCGKMAGTRHSTGRLHPTASYITQLPSNRQLEPGQDLLNHFTLQPMASTETNPTSIKGNEPMHAGLLRDETLFHREIFGYADTRENGRDLSLSDSIPKLPTSSISDLLLVAIDIDTMEGYDQIISNQQFHVGISLFDSRSMETSGTITQARNEPSESGIRSLQFTISDSPYCRKAADKFLFGEYRLIFISELKLRLEQIVSGRNVILVLHSAEQDLEALKNLDIDLHPVSVVDTVKAAQHLLGLYY